mgnify:CR=1 FL=1
MYYIDANVFMNWLGQEPQLWLREPDGIFRVLGSLLHFQVPDWAVGPSLALCVIILQSVWTYVGYNTVIYLAGLGSIPGELTELTAHPYGRLFAGTSATVCLPSALAQRGEYALGNHAGEETLRRIVTGAGFNRWRRTTETPINAIYEARP